MRIQNLGSSRKRPVITGTLVIEWDSPNALPQMAKAQSGSAEFQLSGPPAPRCGVRGANLEKGSGSCVSPWEKTRSLASIGGFKNFSRQWTGSTASGGIHASPEC